jgi:hydrogenase maturation protease
MAGSWLRCKLSDPVSPILVLGVGNSLLGDDGVGIRLVADLARQPDRWGDRVEFVDGGTQGLALLSHVAGRTAVLVLDAVELGAEPGTVHVLRGREVLELGSRSSNAHEGNAGELLRAALVLGDLPPLITLIGIEPENMAIGIGFSQAVQSALPQALQLSESEVDSFLHEAGS